MDSVWNFLAFQVGWFACVLGARAGRYWLGPLVTLPLMAWHFLAVPDPLGEAAFLGVVLVFGVAVDSLEERWRLLDHGRGGRVVGWLCPVWIACLWLLFGSTFHRSLAWLVGRPWLAVFLGGVGGALSYRAGQALGALQIGTPKGRSLMILGLLWALVVPIVAWLAGQPALGGAR